MVGSIVVEDLFKFLPWLLALLGVFSTWFAATRKANVDESGQALQAWKDMTDRHENEIAALKQESENDRQELRKLEDSCYKERQEFRSTIESLHSQMLQLHTSYLAQMTLLADPTNPDHARLLQRAAQLIEQVRTSNG